MKRWSIRAVAISLLLVTITQTSTAQVGAGGARATPGQIQREDLDVRFLQLSPPDSSLLVGASLNMRLLLVLPRREPVDVSQFVTRWISSKPALASVDRHGKVTALKL